MSGVVKENQSGEKGTCNQEVTGDGKEHACVGTGGRGTGGASGSRELGVKAEWMLRGTFRQLLAEWTAAKREIHFPLRPSQD